MDFNRLRADLEVALLSEREALDRLIAQVREPEPDPVMLVSAAESLERFERVRTKLIWGLQEVASERRRREEERSVRQFVLRALQAIRSPQHAGFLEEYVWASERVSLNTRGFGALRRDERRSWARRPGHRLAYIVPCLAEDGRPVARWMARSDWPLTERIIVPGAEELHDLRKVAALLKAEQQRDTAHDDDPFMPLIETYAESVLGIQAPTPSGERDGWLVEVSEEVSTRISKLEGSVERAQAAVAEQLGNLSEEDQLWGR
jgi:hypothetical protein